MAFSGNFVLGIPQLRTANPETNLRRYCFVVSDNRKALFRKFPIRNKSREFASGLVSCREHENDSNPCVIEEKLIKEVTEVISGVDINVKLTSLGGRRRRISGGLDIEAPVKRVWEIMTDYERLPDIIPNIVECRVISDQVGNKQIEQVILLSRTFNIRSRILVKVFEDYLKSLRFLKMQSRDFEEFDGNYRFSEIETGCCRMEYSLDASPNLLFPMSLVERKILKEVPQLLANIRQVALDDNATVHKS